METSQVLIVVVVRGIHVHVDGPEVVQKRAKNGPELPASVHPSPSAPNANASGSPDESSNPIISAPASPLDMETNWAERMLDPATDKPGAPWCYLAKSTTVIGVPFQPTRRRSPTTARYLRGTPSCDHSGATRRAAGANKLVRVEAPAISRPQSAGAREMPLSLIGAKAMATSSERGYGPEKAIDGHLDRKSSWRATPYPQTLTIELPKPKRLRGLHVWPYWGDGRSYKYCVEISGDGKNWTMIGDRSTNTMPATEAGEQFHFAATEVRLIRVRMLYDSLNPGVHVVEVMGIEAEESGMRD